MPFEMSTSLRTVDATVRTPSRHEAQLSELPWLRHIGLLNDYVRIPYANGSSFATQFLYREFRARGHQVTVMGPRDPDARPQDLPERHVALHALPLRTHPGVRLPMPTPRSLARARAQRVDLLLGQTATELTQLGVYLRATQHVPFLCVNTLHLGSAYEVLLPEALADNSAAHALFRQRLIPWIERHCAASYNQTDGLIVLCDGLEQYWHERGVKVPIHVIARSVDPAIFDRPSTGDPFDPRCKPGARLLCVCRHTREKNVSRLLETFALHIAPRRPDATLTLVGDGPDHDTFRAQAQRLGVQHRVFFPGEFPVTEMPAWYRRADLFVYMSLSETYGQVIGEAMWSGLPVVALADGMGVSHQLADRQGGVLVPAVSGQITDRVFAAEVLQLIGRPLHRRALGEQARTQARVRAHPSRIVERYYEAFEHARSHSLQTVEQRIDRPLAPFHALARWLCVQGTVAGLGCLRPPSIINRHGRAQPGWDARAELPVLDVG
jgi:1,2-diacylglycerol 3-alpha-glucosyltransferase